MRVLPLARASLLPPFAPLLLRGEALSRGEGALALGELGKEAVASRLGPAHGAPTCALSVSQQSIGVSVTWCAVLCQEMVGSVKEGGACEGDAEDAEEQLVWSRLSDKNTEFEVHLKHDELYAASQSCQHAGGA